MSFKTEAQFQKPPTLWKALYLNDSRLRGAREHDCAFVEVGVPRSLGKKDLTFNLLSGLFASTVNPLVESVRNKQKKKAH